LLSTGGFSVVITKNKTTHQKTFGKNNFYEAMKWRDDKLNELGIEDRGKSDKLIEIEKQIEKIKSEKHIANNNLNVNRKYFPRDKLKEAIQLKQ